MSTDSRALEEGAPIDYEAFQVRPEFQEYKHRFRRFVFPLAAAFMVWFLLYVLLAAYAHDLMARPFLGLNIGLWFGLAQFVTTFGITMWYVSFANRKLDPATTELRAELERIADGSPGTVPGGSAETEEGPR
ncbi:DUF485 domain-containing protein [Leucobacter triazinivorans]|uniref:DUF485 domain-containing protein n=1 Tax=Leucobacter triazinivorans TaxID=1784719 RepID=A0A4P6KCJ0_9MICO|nr:DUF485 domain-containing protein [Leucobacter triazinivorans]QBE47977.1 DUF485 domain-containing protein [Leucobacter triazinivorans]